MRYDFSTVRDEQTFASIPAGTYGVTVCDVRPGVARDGSVRWSIRLDVTDGEFAGRVACFDSLTWSDRGVQRVKLVLEALGFDVEGTLELEPEELLGKCAQVEVVRESWEDARAVRQTRNTVPFRGWTPVESLPDDAAAYESDPQEAPF
ncbi:MAG: hypothetical protein ACI8QC_002926 [Planctomycetota bacterium]|jgi:hypothetical protein